MPEGRTPGGWVNCQGKFAVQEVGGEKLLKKLNLNASPLVARANAYIGLPDLKDYTLAPMEPIHFPARDGLTIHGYLTVPAGREREGEVRRHPQHVRLAAGLEEVAQLRAAAVYLVPAGEIEAGAVGLCAGEDVDGQLARRAELDPGGGLAGLFLPGLVDRADHHRAPPPPAPASRCRATWLT